MRGGGYPSQVQAGRVPQPGPGGGGGGTPARSRQGEVPQPGPGRGYPSQVKAGGTPPASQQGGTLVGGVPQWGTLGTPSQVSGGYPNGGGGLYPTSLVLDTPRSVCLLRSRRRTFLFYEI